MPLNTPINVQELIIAIKQNGTAIPTIREFKNTVGTITITRESAGFYKLTCTNAFNNVYISHSDPVNRYCMYPLSITTINDSAYQIYASEPDDIYIQVYDSTYTNVDLSTILGNDNELLLPEIKIYNNV